MMSIDEKDINALLQSTFPDDHIYLSRKEDAFLAKLWEGKRVKGITIPTDIFVTNTIPMTDCVITVDETEEDGVVITYRVLIFDEKQTFLRDTGYFYEDVVGVVQIMNVSHLPANCFVAPFFVPLIAANQSNALQFAPPILILSESVRTETQTQKWKVERFLYENAAEGLFTLLETWYGIQIALLHPDVKSVFEHPQKTRNDVSNSVFKKAQFRKAKYVRKHVIQISELEIAAGTKEARKYHRSCLAWYVVGHWRRYKNGSAVFINPHWKGVMRELHTCVERERERVITNAQAINRP